MCSGSYEYTAVHNMGGCGLTFTTAAFGATNAVAEGNPRPTAATTAHVLIVTFPVRASVQWRRTGNAGVDGERERRLGGVTLMRVCEDKHTKQIGQHKIKGTPYSCTY